MDIASTVNEFNTYLSGVSWRMENKGIAAYSVVAMLSLAFL